MNSQRVSTVLLERSHDLAGRWQSVIRRRSFLQGVGMAGATLSTGTLLADDDKDKKKLSKGDAAILRFLAAAELIETDLWQQYNELGGANGGNQSYILALQNIDGDMPQYISDNTDDEMTHASFLNAYLMSKGAQPVNLDAFRTLPSSQATGAQQTGRLTNLMKLNVDTSWYTRYRSTQNPDFGATFPQAVTINNEPAIPVNDADTPPGQPQPVPPATPQQARAQGRAKTGRFYFAKFDPGGFKPLPTAKLK